MSAFGTGKAGGAGVAYGVRLVKGDSVLWLRYADSRRWEATPEISAFAALEEAKRPFQNMPRAALAALEEGYSIELVRLEYAVEVRVLEPKPARFRGRCDCCGSAQRRVYRLQLHDLCGECYGESCDTHGFPCRKRKAAEPEPEVCSECGSDEVEQALWVVLKTEEVNDAEGFGTRGNGGLYCPSCDSNDISIVPKGRYEQKDASRG